MTCPFAEDDAAYVLGSLSPGDRLAFERHLPDCRRCTRSVRGLAGLPGLLGRVQPEVLECPPGQQPAGEQPAPDTLVPALSRRVRRARRRLAVSIAAATAVVTGVGVPVVLSHVTGGGEGAAPASGADAPGSGAAARSMDPVGDVPLQARIALEPVTWGTKLDLACTYDPSRVRAHLPAAMDYNLIVRTRDGHTERVGSWRSVAGRTMHLSAATAADRVSISTVEVRAPDGSVLLTVAG